MLLASTLCTGKMKLFLLVAVSLMSAVCAEGKIDFKTSKVVRLQGQDAVNAFRKHSQVRAVYFYTRDIKNFKFFCEDYMAAAESLEAYGVSLGFCDCTEEVNKDVEPCNIIGVENSIHTYRSGKEMLLLEMSKLFHVHSIVADMLQLVLLRDIPILRNETEVSSYLSDQSGKKDIVFAYLAALGTHDHRAFLEMAYAYKDKLQFVITSDRQATKTFGEQNRSIKDVSTIWWVWASDSSFTSVRYRGKFKVEDLSKFANTITKPKLFDIPADGIDHPFSLFEVPIVKFYYKDAFKDSIYKEADILMRYYGGSVGILMINMDREEAKSKYTVPVELPTCSFQRNAEADEEFIPSDVNTPSVLNFMTDKMDDKAINILDDGFEERTSSEDPPYVLEEVTKQDDPIAEVVHATRKVEMPLDLVQPLTDKTHPKLVKDSDTAAVLFYFPFDALSIGNLRMFGEAADMFGQQTTLQIARVNCYDWTDVCQKEKITIYPTLRVYKKGEKAWDYKGPQDTQAFFSVLKLLELSPPVYETDNEKLMKYLVGKGESTLTGVTNTTVVGLFRKGDKHEKEVFQELARNSRDRIMFVYTDIKDADNIASVPTVVLSRYDDEIQPYTKFDGKFTLQNLQEFVDINKLPKLTVLTPLMFPEVRRKFSELLILFTDGSDNSRQSEDIVREIVKAQKFANVSFNMMQVPDDSSVGYRVLKEYMEEPEIPHLSFVKFQKGEVFNFATGAIDKTSLTNWLSSIFTGAIEPSTKLLEEEWKPMSKGFEYLKIIEWEKRNPEQTGFNPDKTPLDEVSEETTDDDDDDDVSPQKDVSELQRGQHHVFPGRSNHHALHAEMMHKEGDSADEGHSNDKEEMSESAELENQENSSEEKKDKSHDPSEL
ncbi:thioredoxin domain-containing protein 16-like isoform X2 [Mercenaria mercenaria]|uniref:thioredoxin domain-containing protein 16-like isoform X2 n=1 Tax=Mercenaria mercenaria TaxID=6596 RepID=UPI00234E9128|nr:thioredoxin domain-containing protein 16-like isoform X2 [Mercenaria mercenaria]